MKNSFFTDDSLFDMMEEESYYHHAKLQMIDGDTLHEKRVHGTQQFPFHTYFRQNNSTEIMRSSFFWHWHTELELVLVLEGCMDYAVGEQCVRLSAGMGMLINSGTLHRWESRGKYAYVCLVFAPELLAPVGSAIYQNYMQPLLQSGITYLLLEQDGGWQQELLSGVEEIFTQCRTEVPLLELQIQKQMLNIWSILLSHVTPEQQETRTARDVRTQARLCLMMQYVWKHYAERITLDDIAAAANISKSSALRCFQSGIHSSPVDYLNSYRLHQAKKLLHTTQLSVSEIAFAAGFDNVGYFDRIFKRAVGMTPRQFRRYDDIVHKTEDIRKELPENL